MGSSSLLFRVSMDGSLRVVGVVVAFCAALCFGALKGLVVGPIAASVLVLGNVVVLVGLFPAHVWWTIYTILKTNRIDVALKFAFMITLPVLFALWLAIGISGSVLGGVGYCFFTPWISTFEAFRQSCDKKKFYHCIMDGTWGTIKGSCTVVRDFDDVCRHSYPSYLRELRESSADNVTYTIRLLQVPKCIVVGLMGIILEIPLYTIIAVVKSPYMLFKGWQRLLHDLISREGPFLETACVPIAGLAILFWPLVVIGSVVMALFSGIFIGLYGSVIVYEERSFRRGVAFLIAMVSEFDEYTNDWLYLREGSILPKPKYRKSKAVPSEELAVEASVTRGRESSNPPAMLVASLAPSRSVIEAIQEVKMVQVWEAIMISCEFNGKQLLDARVITASDLNDWYKGKDGSQGTIVDVGIPSYSSLCGILGSISAGVEGLLLCTGLELNNLNRPQDRMLDWFFNPMMVLKEQIKIMNLEENEVKILQKLTLFGADTINTQVWSNISNPPQDTLRTAQIQAISRRLVGMTRSISKFPTYRRRYRHVIKLLIAHSIEGSSHASRSNRLFPSVEDVHNKV